MSDEAPVSPTVEQASSSASGRKRNTGNVFRGPGVPRAQRLRSEKHAKRITRRGLDKKKEEEGGLKYGPLVVGLLLFLVVGSAVFQIIQTMGGSLFGRN